MTMDLLRRNKQRVTETVGEKTPAPRAQEFARARGDFDVDGMDKVAEGRDETVEPLGERPFVIATSSRPQSFQMKHLDQRGGDRAAVGVGAMMSFMCAHQRRMTGCNGRSSMPWRSRRSR